MKPTDELYRSLLVAYEHFNHSLFKEKLPDVLFTVQRQKGTLGYFIPDRWSSMAGERCHEIAINPNHMGDSRLIEVLQTLVHEMVHCWQYCFGTPANTCYHNKEWAYKMIEVGLQPTTTGLPGGAITGQQMGDYPIEDGFFIHSCYKLVNEQSFNFPWIDRLSESKSELFENISAQIPDHINSMDGMPLDRESVNELLASSYSELMPDDTFFIRNQPSFKAKRKYQCPKCYANVWGKPELYVVCGDCNVRFSIVG